MAGVLVVQAEALLPGWYCRGSSRQQVHYHINARVWAPFHCWRSRYAYTYCKEESSSLDLLCVVNVQRHSSVREWAREYVQLSRGITAAR